MGKNPHESCVQDVASQNIKSHFGKKITEFVEDELFLKIIVNWNLI